MITREAATATAITPNGLDVNRGRTTENEWQPCGTRLSDTNAQVWPDAGSVVTFEPPLLPFSLRVSGCFPPGPAVCIIATMKDSSLRQARQGLLDDLASARADLLEISASISRNLGHMRSAQWIAATSGFSAVKHIDARDGGTLMSPAQLVASIKQFESEVTHIRELLAHVDARLAEVRAESSASVL